MLHYLTAYAVELRSLLESVNFDVSTHIQAQGGRTRLVVVKLLYPLSKGLPVRSGLRWRSDRNLVHDVLPGLEQFAGGGKALMFLWVTFEHEIVDQLGHFFFSQWNRASFGVQLIDA